jgi:cytochrome b pre-mRNA-processing protein 3
MFPSRLLSRLFREPKLKSDARNLYEAAVIQARTPAFYADHAVPDTVDGRFDMIVLHVWLVLRHFKSAPEALQSRRDKLCQALFDHMITDFDRNIRQIGISDVRVGKHMKAMAKAFYGRIAAYDDAVEADSLAAALERNIFGKPDVDRGILEREAGFLALYVQKQADFLATQPFEALLDGKIAFSGEFGEESR